MGEYTQKQLMQKYICIFNADTFSDKTSGAMVLGENVPVNH